MEDEPKKALNSPITLARFLKKRKALEPKWFVSKIEVTGFINKHLRRSKRDRAG